jgi:Spy/CpxP family protein refolding chaperone
MPEPKSRTKKEKVMRTLKNQIGWVAVPVLVGLALAVYAAGQALNQSTPAAPAKANAATAQPRAGGGPWLARLGNKLGLTADQRTQAQAIFAQARADTQAQFSQVRDQIRNVLTDEQKAKFDNLPHPFAGRGPGAWGGPHAERGFGREHPLQLDRLTSELGLSNDQAGGAKSILDDLHANVATLHDQARQQIRGLLTDEQKAKFDSLPQASGKDASAGGACGGAFGRHAGWAGMRPGGAAGRLSPDERQQLLVQRLTDKLGLDDTQRASIATIVENQRPAIKARWEAARTQFRALLTPEQAATLDQMKALKAPPSPA